MIMYFCNFLFIKRLYVCCAKDFEITEDIKILKPDLVYFGNVKSFDASMYSNVKKSLTYSYNFEPSQSNNDSLFSSMSKDLRYEIRKCSNDNNIKIEIYTGDDIMPSLIKQACKTGNTMFKKKGIKTKIKKRQYLSQLKCGCLIMSVSYYKNTPCVYHAYSIDGTNAICCLIATSYRQTELRGKLSGMIHRYHSFFDMRYFSINKYSYYDWGGISSFDNPNGIDKFKMRFPGYQNITLGSVVPLSRIGSIFIKVKKLLKR